MSNWEEDLKSGAQSPEKSKIEFKERTLSEKQMFIESTVKPVFEKVKKILEGQEKSVTINLTEVPSLKVSPANNPDFEECSCWLTFNGSGQVVGHFGYYEKNNQSYKTQEKVLGTVTQVREDILGRYITEAHNRARRFMA
jgi:hypothetical protein